VVALSLLSLTFESGYPTQPKCSISDHYDGKKFYNPTHPEDQSFWEIVKFLLTSDKQKWPKSVNNNPHLTLNSDLTQDQVAITFVNHASVLIQIRGMNILTDPIWSERASPLSWIGPKRVRAPGIPFEKLPRIDVVLISHNHYDHLDLKTVKRLNDAFKPKFFVPPGDLDLLKDHGIQNVFELDWWDKQSLSAGVEVQMAPTQHFSARGLFDSFKSLWGSYVIAFYGHRIYFGGDTACSVHFKDIREKIGPLDIALLPIGAYEPRWFMKQVHMNPEEAVQAHLDLGSNQSIGIHFGTFQLSDEQIDQPLIDLKIAINKAALKDSSFIVLPEGNTRLYQLGLAPMTAR